MLQLGDEVLGVLLESCLVAAIQGRAQLFLPQPVDLAVSHVQRIVRLAAAALLQAAVQTLLQVVAQRGDDLHGCIGFELPVQAVGGHA
ncbi:hypothetical protein D3C80_1703360 [compost metagenome]